MIYDIAILGDPNDDVPDFAIANQACEGVYKLVQRVMILFLTDINEPKQLGYGTEIPDASVAANIVDEDLLKAQIDQALDDVLDDIQGDQTGDEDPNEALDSLESYIEEATEQDSQAVNILITTLAGEEVTVSMPVSSIFNTESE